MSSSAPIAAADTSPAAWRVVLACFLSAIFAWGFGFYAHGIYIVELQKEHGWSTGLISTIVTAHYVLGALLLPRIAEAITRFGPRVVVLGGLGITAAALLLLPSVTAPWQLALLYIAMAPGWNATSVAPIAATIGQWFDKKRGLALNLALSGATMAGLVVTPTLLAIIPPLGFAEALRLSVLVALAVAGGAALLFVRRGPLSPRPAAAGTSRLAPMRHWHFWSIAAPFALMLVSQVGFLTHLVPLISARVTAGATGLDPGLAVGINAVMALVGRVVLGFVIDRFEPRRASAVCFLVQVAAIALLAVVETPLLVYAACAAYGFSVGNNITLSPLIVQREYGADQFPAIVALSTAVIQILYAFGPGLLGILRDFSGGYGMPLAVCMALNVTAAILVMLPPRAIASSQPGGFSPPHG